MVLVEVIGTALIASASLIVLALVMVYVRSHTHHQTLIDARSSINEPVIRSTPIEHVDRIRESSHQELKMVHVVHYPLTSSSLPRKYGIQWALPSSSPPPPSISPVLEAPEFDQGDSLSLTDTTTSVKELIEKFENQTQKSTEKKFLRKSLDQEMDKYDLFRSRKSTFASPFLSNRSNLTDSDLTSIDSQTVKLDLNQNQYHFSHHSSISNLDITIPSNLSSSIDLEQFECFSTTSNLSECLRHIE